MTARVTSSASDSLGAIPTAGRQGARCGEVFSRSSVVTYSAVARVSRAASTGPPWLDVGFATPILDALLHLCSWLLGGRKLRPLGIGHLGGDAFCAGEMRRQELSGSVQRRGRFVEDRVIGLEDVGHPRGDVEGDLDVGGGSLPGEADGVVEEDLVRSGLDDQGRQARQLGEYGADEAESRVLPRRIVRTYVGWVL